MQTFQKNLTWGQAAETEIALWLRSRGNTVIPIYEKVIDTGKGPQVFTPDKQIVAPDILLFKDGEFMWVEAKRKTAFTWHRITERWVTGIDLRHYYEYQEIMEHFNTDVWIFFYQMGGQAKDSPPSPGGLYGNRLSFLSLEDNENHRSDRHGRSGMVYWSIDKLMLFASMDEMEVFKKVKINNN